MLLPFMYYMLIFVSKTVWHWKKTDHNFALSRENKKLQTLDKYCEGKHWKYTEFINVCLKSDHFWVEVLMMVYYEGHTKVKIMWWQICPALVLIIKKKITDLLCKRKTLDKSFDKLSVSEKFENRKNWRTIFITYIVESIKHLLNCAQKPILSDKIFLNKKWPQISL